MPSPGSEPRRGEHENPASEEAQEAVFQARTGLLRDDEEEDEEDEDEDEDEDEEEEHD